MKKIFIVLAVLFLELNVFAQYDEQFYYPKKEWISSDFPVHEDIYFYPEQDTLHTVFYKPDGTPEATILYLHGNSGNISYYTPYITTLVKAGYQVITVDFRGYGKSSGHPTHQNIAVDGQMILDSLLHRDDIKNTKLILYGASIGTQLATKLAKDNQDKINALVLEGGMSSFAAIALQYIPEEQRETVKPYLVFPYSADTDIPSITRIPKLIIHSPEDEVVPYAQGEQVFQAAQEPKTFLSVRGKHLKALLTEPDRILEQISNLTK